MRTIHSLSALALLLAAATAGCSDATGPTSRDGSTRLSLLASAGGGSAVAGSVAPSVTVSDPGNEIVINRVAVVLREIELERQLDDCPDDGASDSTEDSDACEKFETGPRLLDLNLDGNPQQLVSVDVPPGVYDELEFEIHKPGDDTQEDRDFLAQHPDFQDVSIRVEGTWNGEAFVFLQDLNEDQEVGLSPALEITEESATRNLTLRLDVASWFRTSTGAVLDPRTANDGGPNEELVEENIERSIEAFEDDDGDGHDD